MVIIAGDLHHFKDCSLQITAYVVDLAWIAREPGGGRRCLQRNGPMTTVPGGFLVDFRWISGGFMYGFMVDFWWIYGAMSIETTTTV